jgi:hypothetical protein
LLPGIEQLVQGENLIAVDVHQDFATSSDIVFRMKLDGEELARW